MILSLPVQEEVSGVNSGVRIFALKMQTLITSSETICKAADAMAENKFEVISIRELLSQNLNIYPYLIIIRNSAPMRCCS